MEIVAIDFFCGAGGLTFGLQQSGINVLCGIDFDNSVAETYKSNNNVPFLHADINELSYSQLGSILKTKKNKKQLILFAGCAPCQPFSKINRSGSTAREMNALLRFGEFIDRFRPHFVISENVPQIKNQKKIFKRFIKMLENAGYNVCYALLNAKDYGVPQNRLRLVLLASRVSDISIPKLEVPERTVRDAIAHFPKISSGGNHKTQPNHIAMKLSPLNLKRITATQHDGGDSRTWPKKLQLDCHMKTEGYYDVYGRMFWDKPAPTLTTRCISYSNGRFGHPEQDRAISIREAAAIQSFPDDFVFHGSMTMAARHIGNAVPPLLAKSLGSHIQDLVKRKNE